MYSIIHDVYHFEIDLIEHIPLSKSRERKERVWLQNSAGPGPYAFFWDGPDIRPFFTIRLDVKVSNRLAR